MAHSSTVRRALATAACTIAIAVSGFSPKSEGIFSPKAANAQDNQGERERQMARAKKFNNALRLKSGMWARLCAFHLDDLRTGNASNRLDSAEAVAFACRADQKAGKAVSALIRTLKDRNWEVRAKAAEELGKISEETIGDREIPAYPDVKAAVPALRHNLEHRSPLVRRSAALALGKMREQDAIEKLRQMGENDPDESVRNAAVAAYSIIRN